MRHLTSLPDATQAENFSDYLTGEGIRNSRDESAGAWAIWIEREEQLDQARAELAQFQQQPDAQKYQKAARSARAYEAAQDQLTRTLAKNHIDFRLHAAQTEVGVQQHFPATIALIAACVLVSLVSRLGEDLGRIDGFFLLPYHAVVANRIQLNAWELCRQFSASIWVQMRWAELGPIRDGQYWRLITPIFVHFGFMHLLFDMWWLWELGKFIERRKGTVFFLLLVLVSAVFSNIGDFAWTGPSLAGGMSGVVYALFGYVWMKGLLQPDQRLGINSQAVWIMLGWLVLCMTGMMGPIANGAHVFGLIIGVIIGVVPWLALRARKAF